MIAKNSDLITNKQGCFEFPLEAALFFIGWAV